MYRLIWVFSGQTGLIVSFAMRFFAIIDRSYYMGRNMRKHTWWYVHLTKTQISLRIRTVWSDSSLSTWRNFASLAIQTAPSEDSDQSAHSRRLIRIFTGRILNLVWIFTGRICPKILFLTLRLLRFCVPKFFFQCAFLWENGPFHFGTYVCQ